MKIKIKTSLTLSANILFRNYVFIRNKMSALIIPKLVTDLQVKLLVMAAQGVCLVLLFIKH